MPLPTFAACQQKTNLGCFSYCPNGSGSCSAVQLPIIATQTGAHTFEIEFMGSILEQATTATTTEKFEIDICALNEDFTYNMRIKMPDGNYFTDTEGASCFLFRVMILKTV